MKADSIPISAWISLAFWISLAGLRMHEAWQNARLIPALLAAQSGLIAWLLITRRQQALETLGAKEDRGLGFRILTPGIAHPSRNFRWAGF